MGMYMTDHGESQPIGAPRTGDEDPDRFFTGEDMYQQDVNRLNPPGTKPRKPYRQLSDQEIQYYEGRATELNNDEDMFGRGLE